MKNLTVYKSNEVIEAGYRLSLNEQRVILACIGQVDSAKPLLATDLFELSAKDFATLFSVSDKTAYEALNDVTETLFNRYIIINNPFPDNPKAQYLKTRWISSIVYYPEQGKISLRFAIDMLPYLSELKKAFTRYKLEHIGKMTSIYAIRLYELLIQWKSTGKREIEIDWLKKQFEIEDQYVDMHNFKKRVIDPAVKDINTHSNFTVSWTQRKTGRRVTHLTFEFAEKTLPKTKSKKEKAKDQNTTDLFHGLTDKQIDFFSVQLGNDSEFGGKYGKIGEDMNPFIQRLKRELRDTEKQRLYLPYLLRLGLKVK